MKVPQTPQLLRQKTLVYFLKGGREQNLGMADELEI